MDYLHRICKIIHTDLKPENCIVALGNDELGEIVKNGRIIKKKSKKVENQNKSPGLGLKKAQTLNRRATIFAGDFDDDDELIQRDNLKNYFELKKQEKLDIIQYRIVGKPKPYQITSESNDKLMIRFLIHFLFVDHDHSMVNLYDPDSQIFKVFKKQP